MELDQQGAEDALRSYLGSLPSGYGYVAIAVPGTGLWWVGTSDSDAMPYAVGAGYLVGPDGRIWTVSSNTAIHDHQLAERLLDTAYRQHLADFMTPENFADRLLAMTEARRVAEREFVAALRAGVLRVRQERRLP